MKLFLLSLVFLGSGLVVFGRLPALDALGSSSFVERGKAMAGLEAWVLSDQAKAKKVLLEKYLRCPDPEIRVRLLELLERSYFPIRGFVGITMRSTLWDQLGRLKKDKLAIGVRITDVGKGTPAELSGLRVDDIVLKVNQWTVKGGADVTTKVSEQIQKHPPRTPISLQIARGEEILTLSLKLGILPIPSARARTLRAGTDSLSALLPTSLQLEISTFQAWLAKEIEKDRKNLIADRRL